MRLCIAWVVPYWLLIELMPTKLPHYALPLFPALCIMAGAAALTLLAVKEFSVLRRINAVLFLLVSAVLIGAIMAGQSYYGPAETSQSLYVYIIGGIAGLLAIIAAFALWQSKVKIAMIMAGVSTLVMSVATYQFILPNLTQLRVADQIVSAFKAENIALPRHGGPDVASPHFTEPSLVYRLGKDINVTDKIDLLDMDAFANGLVILLDLKREGAQAQRDAVDAPASRAKLCVKTSAPIKGFNYSKGGLVEIVMLRMMPCPEGDISGQ
jgi:4-amino-4-deoxy-L-arabinose transferase-like glycosyltransferase